MPTKYYGAVDSEGSGYVEFNANYPVAQLAGLNLIAHVGHQKVEGASAYDYTDWQIGVNKDFAVGSSTGWNAGLSYIDTDADSSLWVYSNDPSFKSGEGKVLGYIKRTF